MGSSVVIIKKQIYGIIHIEHVLKHITFIKRKDQYKNLIGQEWTLMVSRRDKQGGCHKISIFEKD